MTRNDHLILHVEAPFTLEPGTLRAQDLLGLQNMSLLIDREPLTHSYSVKSNLCFSFQLENFDLFTRFIMLR